MPPFRMQHTALHLDPNQDDAGKCVDQMRPELQSLINQGYGLNALLWAINMNFAELVLLRGGDNTAIAKVMAVFPELNRRQRDQAQICYRRLKTVRQQLNRTFSYDALMWALIGAVGNISRGVGLPEQEVTKVTGDMIVRLNMARRSSMN